MWWIWLAQILAAAQEALCYTCNYDSDAILRPPLNDGGILESPNYPGEYSAYRSNCQVALKVCRGCVLSLVVDDMTLPQCIATPTLSTYGPDMLCDPSYSCDYMLIKEANQATLVLSGDSSRSVVNVTSSVKLMFCFGTSESDPDLEINGIHFMKKWRIRFFVNSGYDYRITGTHAIQAPPTTVQSPGFPHQISHSNHSIMYYFHGDTHSDCILLSFSDFNLCSSSNIKIYSGISLKFMEQTYTYIDRPMQLLSTSPELLLVWDSGADVNQTCSGFRAQQVFVPCQKETPPTLTGRQLRLPHADCARVSAEDGGALSQFIPALSYRWTSSVPPWTCMWSLPTRLRSSILLHLSIMTARDSTVHHKGPPSLHPVPFLEILESTFSTGPSLMSLTDIHNVSRADIQSDTGLYVRVASVRGWSYTLSLTYTPYVPLMGAVAFNESCELPGGMSGYACLHSALCIPAQLVCDGHAHCWHGEDERLRTCDQLANVSGCPINASYSCYDGNGCYSDQQLCDGIHDCIDGSDEGGCYQNAYARQTGPGKGGRRFWPFFLPALLLLVCIMAVGCSIYRNRRFSLLNSGGRRRCHDIQLHSLHRLNPTNIQNTNLDTSLSTQPLYLPRSPTFPRHDEDYGETEPLMA